ncbi:MAG: DUF3052 domain-containing protein [Chloroflexota bacterium]|nr:DUF3052 domain-containing protein [Chloroflexota bacterium]
MRCAQRNERIGGRQLTASAAPLSRKLGIRPGARVAVVGAPAEFVDLLGSLPRGARLVAGAGPRSDVIVLFATRGADLAERFGAALPSLAVDGGLWLAYPKQTSGVATDLTFASIQRLGLDAGLVDNKSCAIDATWTALRFVVPLARRQTWAG